MILPVDWIHHRLNRRCCSTIKWTSCRAACLRRRRSADKVVEGVRWCPRRASCVNESLQTCRLFPLICSHQNNRWIDHLWCNTPSSPIYAADNPSSATGLFKFHIHYLFYINKLLLSYPQHTCRILDNLEKSESKSEALLIFIWAPKNMIQNDSTAKLNWQSC